MHGVLAADLVGEGRHLEGLLHAPDDVQVRLAGLHHHHVGTLCKVGGHFVQRLVTVGRVHLVGVLAALAQVGGRTHRVAERAVVGAGVLG
ncbi:hypothetical protein D3C77_567260 [compost metagenome]